MLNNRQKNIVEILKVKRSVRIIDLSQELKVSRETIRKDLILLENEGYIKKIYGGAVLDESNTEQDYLFRKTSNTQSKKLIAQEAKKYIEPGDTIYLDYGSTNLTLAQEIKDISHLTVITNSIPIVNELVHSDNIELIILGGNVRKNEDSLFGSFALNNAEQIYVDLGFFSCAGIDPKAGITNYHMGEIELSKLMVSHSRNAIFLVDESKFGKQALYKTANLEDVDIIITDKADHSDMQEIYKENHIEINIIDKNEGLRLYGIN